MGPILIGSANIFDFAVQIKLKEVIRSFNLTEFSIADRITCLGKSFGTLSLKGDVKMFVPVVFHFRFCGELSGFFNPKR